MEIFTKNRVWGVLIKTNAAIAYSYITEADRETLDLSKSQTLEDSLTLPYHNDAFIIADGTNQIRCKPLNLEQIRRNRRSLEQFYDAKYIDTRMLQQGVSALRLGIGFIVGIGGVIATASHPVLAQIKPDTTLNAEPSVVTPNVNVRGLSADRIDGGATRGSILFHSFQEFNIENGQRVYFANPSGIRNIFSRVTGSNISNILGTLGVDGSANLFLLNPNGILFGPNARLDIAGSLVATTANRLVFNNGIEFSATNPKAPPLLTVNLRPGLQYGSNPGGTISNEGNLAVGRNLTFFAGNLNLQGQLHAGKNLILSATDTVQVRDSLTKPFVASSGDRLLVQGNQGIDIFALNHPESGLFSGKDMVLRSANTVEGDAHYYALGNFRIEQLDRRLGNLHSPYDPVILANGDVRLGNYTGASLHILAGGSVTLGNVVINGTDTAANTISPNNPNPFLANLANVVLSDGTSFAIDGSTLPTLDVRAGIDWTALGGLPGNSGGGVVPTPTFGTRATSATIKTRSINNAGGLVFLTNQYNPNLSLLSGNISSTGRINTTVADGNAGDIIAIATGDISTAGLRSYVQAGGSGDGGDIFLSSQTGSIDTSGGDVNSSTKNGRSGDITLTAFGKITTADVGSYIGTRGTGQAGDITLISEAGTIDTSAGTLYSSTVNGNGGTVTLTAASDITTAGIQSFVGYQGIGFSGNITLTSTGGAINTTAGSIESVVGDEGVGFGGNVTLFAFGNITTADIKSRVGDGGNGSSGDIVLTSQTGAINTKAGTLSSDSPDDVSGSITLTAAKTITPGNINSSNAGSGDAGKITLTSDADVLISGSSIESQSFGSGQAGDINIMARSVYLSDLAMLATNTNGAGNSGNVDITTQSLYVTGGSEVLAQTFGQGKAGNIIVNASDSVTLSGVAPYPVLKNDKPGGFSSGLFVTTEQGSTGNGGNIEIYTGALHIEDGAVLSARSRSAARGGDVTVNVNTLDITGGGQILTTAFSSGSAGGITVNATGPITISGSDSTYSERFKAVADAFGEDQAKFTIDPVSSVSGLQAQSLDTNSTGSGNISITAESLFINNGAQLSTSTKGQGDAGNVSINVRNALSLTGSQTAIFSTVESGATANGGRIDIQAGSLSLKDGAQLQTLVREPSNTLLGGQGNAGDMVIDVRDAVSLDGVSQDGLYSQITSQVQSGAVGQGGNISITSGSLSLSNGARLDASTYGTGRAGNIKVEARDAVTLFGLTTVTDDGNSSIKNSRIVSEVGSSDAVGDGGNIDIKARSLFMNDRSEIGVGTYGRGNAGNISVHVDDSVVLTRVSSIRSLVEQGGVGRGGKIEIQARSLNLTDGGQIGASVFREENNQPGGEGQGGDITINAPDFVNISGVGADPLNPGQSFTSGLFVSTEQGAIGRAGNLTVNTSQLRLTDSGVVTAETRNANDAGSITINANTLEIANGGKILSASTSSGNAGGIFLNVNDQLTIQNGGKVSVSGEATGNPGNLEITAGSIYLNQGGKLQAVSNAGENANITLKVGNSIEMRYGSEISAEAFNNGNGGNITINAGDNVFAILSENSDIVANAYGGTGGNITAKAQGIFGFRNSGKIRTPESDFTASSEIGIDGTVNVETQDNLSQPLPTNLVDRAGLIDRRCKMTRGPKASSFTITGRGGLPPNPSEPLRSDAVESNWVNLDSTPKKETSPETGVPTSITPNQLVEAQGWIIGPNGKVILTAQAQTVTPQNNWVPVPECNAPQATTL